MLEKHRFGDDPDITIVVPTIPSSPHDLLLSKLQEQNTRYSYEVIIVNDYSLDICEARNKGIKEASSEIIALTDDDCLPPQDWVSNIMDAYNSSSVNICCVEGAVKGGLNYNGKHHYVGCNLSFKREAALEVGGFRSKYAGYRDDTEFGWRLEERDEGKCKFDASVTMHHPGRPRSDYNPELEKELKEEYPNKYQSVFQDDFQERVYLLLAKIGVVGNFNKLYDKARNLEITKIR